MSNGENILAVIGGVIVLAFLYWFFDIAQAYTLAVVWLKANPIVLAIILATIFISIVISANK